MLCYRCEYRALWHEEKGNPAPRFECGLPSNSIFSCYMFKPVHPIAIENAPSYNLEYGLPPAIGPRMVRSKKQPSLELVYHKIKSRKFLPYWRIKK